MRRWPGLSGLKDHLHRAADMVRHDREARAWYRRFPRRASFRPVRASTPCCAVNAVRAPGERLLVWRIHLTFPSLPPRFEGYRIVHLSDFHYGPARAHRSITAGITQALDLAPDLIVLTGDFVDTWVDQIVLPAALRRLHAPDGVWAVLGNHDHWTDAGAVRRILSDSGVDELFNKNVRLERGGEAIYLAGVDDVASGQPDLSAALAGIPPGALTVLLAHEPDFADEAAATGRVALQLSGHTHGGAVRLPVANVPLLSLLIYYGRKYPVGLYHLRDPLGEMWLYTSAGLGHGRTPRFNVPPDIAEITLHYP